MNRNGVVVLAALFVALFALLLGLIGGQAIKAHKLDDQMAAGCVESQGTTSTTNALPTLSGVCK